MNKDRQRIVYEILALTVYGKRKRAEIGIERLLEEGVFSAAYPLHDVSVTSRLIEGIRSFRMCEYFRVNQRFPRTL